MLDVKMITENPDAVAQKLAKKGCVVDFTEMLAWEKERRAITSEIEQLKAERNRVSATVPKLKKEGKPVDAIFAEMRTLGEEIASGDKKIFKRKFSISLRNFPTYPTTICLQAKRKTTK